MHQCSCINHLKGNPAVSGRLLKVFRGKSIVLRYSPKLWYPLLVMERAHEKPFLCPKQQNQDGKKSPLHICCALPEVGRAEPLGLFAARGGLFPASLLPEPGHWRGSWDAEEPRKPSLRVAVLEAVPLA